MTDQILINGLFLRTIIGINDDERDQKQDVLINVSLTVDTRPAGRSDDIADAVNYRTITKDVIDLVENSKFFLVERMVEEIARLCLSDERVERVRVSIEKPAALRFARSVGVANVRKVWDDLEHKPAHVTRAAEGAGFEELVRGVLRARREKPRRVRRA